MTSARSRFLTCCSPAGLHRMHYLEWGDPGNARVLVCVHGLSRVAADFDRLARALAPHFRVVCPDVVGRGRSDWLRDPLLYGIAQYVSDMVCLIARLDVPSVAWLGTSMGGLIGMALAGQEGSPIARLVLNDVGPRLEPAALARIGAYFGKEARFADLDEASAFTRKIAPGFGLKTEEEWREITASVLRRDGDAFVYHYDPRIAEPMRALTPEQLAAGEQLLWKAYDGITCPTLVLRGADSDLLTVETLAAMQVRGPRAEVATIPDTGHAPMLFDPEQIRTVSEFLLRSP